MMEILQRDSLLEFPSVMVVDASAGSGKTLNLTRKLLQLLLSNRIPHNQLRNVLAVTFTNNATREMRQRVLGELKKIVLEEPESLRTMRNLLDGDTAELPSRANALLESILQNFGDLQIRTIDSFLVGILRSSAMSYGFSPEVEILLGDYRLVEKAFDRYFRIQTRSEAGKRSIQELVELVSENRRSDQSFIWDPYSHLTREMKRLVRDLASEMSEPVIQDASGRQHEIKDEIHLLFKKINDIVIEGSWQTTKNFDRISAFGMKRDILELVQRAALSSVLLKKQQGHGDLASANKAIASLCTQINTLVSEFALLHAQQFYLPYLRATELISRTLDGVKREEGTIFIEDVNKLLLSRIVREQVPEIYFRLGETIYHFLIDEFQDTSPIQWRNLEPLIENSLAEGGTLFAVGDTKQSIFGFRGADWRVMKTLETTRYFPSARSYETPSLTTNYRSGGVILGFVRDLFQKRIAQHVDHEILSASGLSNFVQDPQSVKEEDGYVTVQLVAREEPGEDPERVVLGTLLDQIRARGYAYRDIAIITPENENVVRVSGWLNEREIPFLSHSSLDVRKRKVVGEILALLHFLDSPIDDHSFSTFLFGEIFRRFCTEEASPAELRRFVFHSLKQSDAPLYKRFQESYPSLWEKAFRRLLTVVGYLPTYDLVCEVIKILGVFQSIPEEEASFAKFAEVVRLFEGEGSNTLKEFLSFAEEDADSGRWNIDIPAEIDAVTLMTVHKAKGLGFPVTIVLLYDGNIQVRNMIMHEHDGHPMLLRVNAELRKKHADIEAVYAKERQKAEVDALNKVYVALTRAEAELHIVGVHDGEPNVPTKYFPESGTFLGVPGHIAPVPIKHQSVPLHHRNERAPTEVAASEGLHREERRRGEVVHALLACIETVGTDVQENLRKAMETLAGIWPANILEDARNVVASFLTEPSTRFLFAASDGRVVLNEKEFVSAEGHLFRMDRVVVDPEKVLVVDLKTGNAEQEESYRTQLQTYARLARECFPGRQVEAYLAYIDKSEIRRVI